VSSFIAEDLRFQLEESPFSEEIILRWTIGDAGVTLIALDGTEITAINGAGIGALGGGETGLVLRGIFDESAERDAGTKSVRVKPRVLVFRWPVPAPPDTRVRVRGKEYAVTSHERDANLGIVAWLR
jgi:hypothetical protein